MEELSDKNRPQKLEDIFREGMGEAEFTPSERLWDRIEQGLDAKSEATYYKKRLIWFQRLAAACVVLVLFAGGYLFYDQQIISESQSANVKTSQSQENAADNIAAINKEKASESLLEQPAKPEIKENTNNLALGSSVANSNKSQSMTETSSLASSQVNMYSKANTSLATSSEIKVAAEKSSSLLNSLEPITVINYKADESGLALTKTPEINQQEQKELFTGAENSKVPDSGANNETAILAIVAKPSAASITDEKSKSKASRWSFSGKYASHYFNQNIALAENSPGLVQPGFQVGNAPLANASNSSLSEALNEYDNNTLPSYSYNTAMGAAYQLDKHWALETGIDYTQNVASTKSSYVFNNAQLASRYGNFTEADNAGNKNFVIVPTTAFVASLAGPVNYNNAGVIKTQTFSTQYRYRLIGIPVRINYKTAGNKSFYYASVGFLTNLLMQAHILSESSLVPDLKYAPNRESPFQKWQVATVASVGKGFRITKDFNIRAGIEASQYLTSLAAHPQYLEGKHGKPYTIGLSLSSSYSLGK